MARIGVVGTEAGGGGAEGVDSVDGLLIGVALDFMPVMHVGGDGVGGAERKGGVLGIHLLEAEAA